MDVVNIRYGKEATTPEATDGWYKVGLMTLGTQLRAVPGMIRNASGPSVVPILRCVFLQHSGQEHISNEDAAVNQPHSRGLRQESLGATAAGPARCGYNQLDASERLRRPSDSKRHRDWQGKWPGAYRWWPGNPTQGNSGLSALQLLAPGLLAYQTYERHALGYTTSLLKQDNHSELEQMVVFTYTPTACMTRVRTALFSAVFVWYRLTFNRSFSLFAYILGTSEVVLGEPIAGTRCSPVWNDEPGGPGMSGTSKRSIFWFIFQISLFLPTIRCSSNVSSTGSLFQLDGQARNSQGV